VERKVQQLLTNFSTPTETTRLALVEKIDMSEAAQFFQFSTMSEELGAAEQLEPYSSRIAKKNSDMINSWGLSINFLEKEKKERWHFSLSIWSSSHIEPAQQLTYIKTRNLNKSCD
jgi:hypothetical protein